MGWDIKTELMKARSVMDPTLVVVEEGRISMPKGVKPSSGRDSMSAVPRWPADPVTSTSYEDIDLVMCHSVGWSMYRVSTSTDSAESVSAGRNRLNFRPERCI